MIPINNIWNSHFPFKLSMQIRLVASFYTAFPLRHRHCTQVRFDRERASLRDASSVLRMIPSENVHYRRWAHPIPAKPTAKFNLDGRDFTTDVSWLWLIPFICPQTRLHYERCYRTWRIKPSDDSKLCFRSQIKGVCTAPAKYWQRDYNGIIA